LDSVDLSGTVCFALCFFETRNQHAGNKGLHLAIRLPFLLAEAVETGVTTFCAESDC